MRLIDPDVDWLNNEHKDAVAEILSHPKNNGNIWYAGDKDVFSRKITTWLENPSLYNLVIYNNQKKSLVLLKSEDGSMKKNNILHGSVH